jgi:RNA polymerase sigma factor (sigma-70 family)
MRVLDDRVEALQCQSPTQANLAAATTAEEQYLLQRVTQHDEEAFNALYARYAPQVRRFLRRRLARHTLIDDVLQDVMLMLWQHAAKAPQTVPLGAWLCGVARRKAYKALAYAATAPVAQVTSEHLDADDPELVLLQQEYRGTLARVLDALPYGERTAIKLVSQGCSYQEIGAATGDPVSTIRTRVSRACQRLRMRIAALESGPPSPSSLTSSQQVASVPTSRRHRAW